MRAAVSLALASALIPGAAGARHHAAATLPIGQSATYRCTDGRSIELLFAGDGSAVLTADDAPVTLAPIDRTGAHFAGGGWRWFSSSATTGWLARIGPTGRNDKGTACAAG